MRSIRGGPIRTGTLFTVIDILAQNRPAFCSDVGEEAELVWDDENCILAGLHFVRQLD